MGDCCTKKKMVFLPTIVECGGNWRTPKYRCTVLCRFSESRFFDVSFRPNRFAIVKAVSVLTTEAVVSMHKHVFQALLYFLLAVFFVYYCALLCYLSRYFNVL
jgi:hypothetical protein